MLKYLMMRARAAKVRLSDDTVVETHEPTGATKVAVQDQTTDDISIYLAQHLTAAEVIAPAPLINAESLNIQTGGVAPIVGNFICLKSGSRFLQAEIVVVTPISGNDYTVKLSMPIDFAFPVGAGCEVQNVDMNVNGSATPVEFRVGPGNLDVGTDWDITRFMPTMILTTAGDDGLFGNLPALTAATGTYFRIEDSDTGTKNLFNATVNGDFADEGFDITYPLRSGGQGSFGMRSRITINGPDKRGVVKRLHVHSETESDTIVAKVRANLSTLGRFRVKVQGHVVAP